MECISESKDESADRLTCPENRFTEFAKPFGESTKNYTWARNEWPESLSFFKNVNNVKMGSNGAATASEHTYVLVTGTNR